MNKLFKVGDRVNFSCNCPTCITNRKSILKIINIDEMSKSAEIIIISPITKASLTGYVMLKDLIPYKNTDEQMICRNKK